MEKVSYDLPDLVVKKGCLSSVTSLPLSARGIFRPTGIFFSDDEAARFLVTDVKVGRNSQLLSTGTLPGELFAEHGPRPDFDFNVMRPGDRLTVCVQFDPTYESICRRLRCHVIGRESVEPCPGAMVCLGYGSTTVESTANINVQPQVSFVPTHLFLPAYVDESFVVERVGVLNIDRGRNVSPAQLATRGTMCCSGRMIEIGLAPVPEILHTDFLTIAVRNKGSVPKVFRAAVLGVSVREGYLDQQRG